MNFEKGLSIEMTNQTAEKRESSLENLSTGSSTKNNATRSFIVALHSIWLQANMVMPCIFMANT